MTYAFNGSCICIGARVRKKANIGINSRQKSGDTSTSKILVVIRRPEARYFTYNFALFSSFDGHIGMASDLNGPDAPAEAVISVLFSCHVFKFLFSVPRIFGLCRGIFVLSVIFVRDECVSSEQVPRASRRWELYLSTDVQRGGAGCGVGKKALGLVLTV